MEDIYFGHYRSTTSAQTGCVKEFFTVGQATLRFAPQVLYRCDLCGIEHGFRFSDARMATTLRQRRALDDYCARHAIERDVRI